MKHKMKKKQRHMKTLQFKRKRKKIKTIEFRFKLPKPNKRSFKKFSKREIRDLQLKETLVPCPKCFSTDKLATAEAGSRTTTLKGAEAARAH